MKIEVMTTWTMTLKVKLSEKIDAMDKLKKEGYKLVSTYNGRLGDVTLVGYKTELTNEG